MQQRTVWTRLALRLGRIDVVCTLIDEIPDHCRQTKWERSELRFAHYCIFTISLTFPCNNLPIANDFYKRTIRTANAAQNAVTPLSGAVPRAKHVPSMYPVGRCMHNRNLAFQDCKQVTPIHREWSANAQDKWDWWSSLVAVKDGTNISHLHNSYWCGYRSVNFLFSLEL